MTSTDFLPHSVCYLWDHALISLHLVADSLIALAYYAMPVMLVTVVRKRHDLPFNWMFWLFGAFIIACGTTHVMQIVTLWTPAYWLAGGIKVATATVSILTAVLLGPVVPKALALPSPSELARLNRALQDEIQERCQAEAALAVALEHREMLLRELHHRVKNNLQLIMSLMRLQARYLTDPAVLDAFTAAGQRLQAIALMHNVLDPAQHEVDVDCGRYLEQLVSALTQAYGTGARAVQLHVEAQGVRLNPETALPCGLIVHELVANALKHAFPAGQAGAIEVSLTQHDAELTLAVSDSGVGLPADELSESASLGWRLVRALTQQLDGTLAFDSNGGTRVQITFPA